MPGQQGGPAFALNANGRGQGQLYRRVKQDGYKQLAQRKRSSERLRKGAGSKGTWQNRRPRGMLELARQIQTSALTTDERPCTRVRWLKGAGSARQHEPSMRYGCEWSMRREAPGRQGQLDGVR